MQLENHGCLPAIDFNRDRSKPLPLSAWFDAWIGRKRWRAAQLVHGGLTRIFLPIPKFLLFWTEWICALLEYLSRSVLKRTSKVKIVKLFLLWIAFDQSPLTWCTLANIIHEWKNIIYNHEHSLQYLSRENTWLRFHSPLATCRNSSFCQSAFLTLYSIVVLHF